jgi:CelD/BcsL family acetyltransferase involved in cellulose biosynthesis
MPASTTTPTARRLTDAAAIRRAWLALEAEGHLASAFQRHAWLWTWQEEVGAAEGIEPVVVLVEGTDGMPWMLLPMGLRRWRGGRTLSWLGGDITGYHGPIVGRACPVGALARQKSAWLAERGLHDIYAGGHLAGLQRRMWREHPDRFHVSAVSVGGVIVATHCGVVSDGAFHYWFASYLPGETQRFSPGELLVRELMAWCCARGVGVFDFGIGDHGYKLRWSDRSVPLHECVVGRTLRGRALVARARAERVARRRLKESERLYPMALELRARLRGGGA